MNSKISRRDVLVGATTTSLAIALASQAVSKRSSRPGSLESVNKTLQGGFDPIVVGPASAVIPVTGGYISITISLKGADDSDDITFHVKPFAAQVKYASGRFYADLTDDPVPGIEKDKFYQQIHLNKSNGHSDTVKIPVKEVTADCEIIVCAYNSSNTGLASVRFEK